MGKILLAASPQPRKMLVELLAPCFELCCVTTVKQALDAAHANPPDLVFCTVLFDESHYVDLLKSMQSDHRLALIPFIACRAVASQLRDRDVEAIAKAACLLGARQFIDLVDLSRLGQTREVISRIDSCLPAQKRSTAVRQAG